MLKNIVLALEVGSSRDAARDYAISVAAAFDAHLAAIGFNYAPVLPPADTVSAIPLDILDAEREENRRAAIRTPSPASRKRRGWPPCRPSRVWSKARCPALPRFSERSLARSTCPWSARPSPNRYVTISMIEGSLFNSGRPVLAVPYIQRAGARAGRVMKDLSGMAAAMPRARSTTPCRFSLAPRRSMW